MQLHPRVTSATVDFAARFEGLRRRAARLPGGGWTIGYGHTRTAREGAEVSEDEARALLAWDLSQAAGVIEATVFAPLDANAFDALCDFGFNVGEAAFRTSEVLRRLNEGRPLRAAAALEMWRRADLGGASYIVDAVVRRRAAEKALFLTPDAGFPAAPTSVVRPQLDRRLTYGTDRLAATEEAAVACLVPLDGDDPRPVVMERTAVSRAADAVAGRLALVGREPGAEAEPPPFAAAPLEEAEAPVAGGEGPPAHDARTGFPAAGARRAPARAAAWIETGVVWSAIGLIGLVLFGVATVCILDRPTVGCLLVALLGVAIMFPAAVRLLGGRPRTPA
ncbi:MAG: lysozyme [Caulobacteraceae bacterium]|nr:lysozyme [Caulobacter sp.]